MKKIGVFILVAMLSCGPTKEATKPKLVMVIVLDQFRSDYLTRFEKYFGDDGFRYLMKNGAVMTNCKYPQATTHTSAGHAIIMSGNLPNRHGIISNWWFDRRQNKNVNSVEDSSSNVIDFIQTSPYQGRSPKNFSGTNFADDWRAATQDRAKVFGVSNKDRSAILMAGKHANGAYWFHEFFGGVYSSKYYMTELPGWVKEYNRTNPSDKWNDALWEPILDITKYPGVDSALMPFYNANYGFEKTFPHKIISKGNSLDSNYYSSRMWSPYGLEQVTDFTKLLMENEEIGQDAITDLLCVSYSSLDGVGHDFGPNSPEVMDMVIRIDREMARLIKYANKRLGEKNILYVLTSDHGIGPLPEEVRRSGTYAGRISPLDLGREIDQAMELRFGKLSKSPNYVRIIHPDLYIQADALEEKKIDKHVAENYISAFLAKKPFVNRVFTSRELRKGVSGDSITQAVLNNYYPENSGDVVIVLKPHVLWDYDGLGAEHSLPYDYDAQVPMIFSGKKWIQQGVYSGVTSPADIAPTLEVLLEMQSGLRDGKAMNEILKTSKIKK